MKTDKKRIINLILGPVLMAIFTLVLPRSIFETSISRMAIGTVVWMAFWWVTGPVDYAVTGFVPIAVNAVFQLTDMSKLIANYASETILLLLGASIIIVAWDVTGLDNRIAARFLGIVGGNYRAHLVFWFFLAMLLSTVLPNAVVCATVTPLAVAMLKYVGEEDISNSKKGSRLLLYIAYATGIGGLASPLGGAMNLVTVEYLQQITGEEYYYTAWVIRFLPVMVVLAIMSVIFMLRGTKKDEQLGQTKEYFKQKYSELPKMSSAEIWSLVLFLIAVVLAFSRKLYQGVLPGLKPAYSFIICAILTFFISDSEGKRVMRWKNIQGKIEWEMILIFAGGLGAGTIMSGSGAVDAIGAAIASSGFKSGIGLVFGIITFTLLLSDVTSNTATAAVAMPIVISIVSGMGENPIPYIYIASIGVNLSFMLPTSIRAIPVGYGLKPGLMFKEGWKISVAVIILMTALGYLLLKYWPAFSTI